jgi:hypothetical protein
MVTTGKLQAVLGGITVLGTLAAVAVAGPAGAASVRDHAAAQHRAKPTASRLPPCPHGDFCAFSGTNYTGNFEDFTHNDKQWKNGIINNEESVVDQYPGYVRLYYGPDYGNPHACLENGNSFPNLKRPFDYYFNTNVSGSRKYVWRDVHGSTMDKTVCKALMASEN